MTSQKQRIAIAEACGHGDYGTRMNWLYDEQMKGLPDYLHDLNAMHEAEKVMCFKDRNNYIDLLGMTYNDSWEFCRATAAQRAEAFLRTIGKWEDDK